MEYQDQAKLFDLIKNSQRVLVALPANPSGDVLGSGLALAGFLRKEQKEVTVICEAADFGRFSFLPGIAEIRHEIILPKNFVISVRTDKTKLDELSYDLTDAMVNVYLKPKQGVFTPEDVSFSAEAPAFNLIVCIDTPSLELLGDLYANNAEMFFQLPKVNIDNHINNENYGTINIVDVTASSTAEIVLQLLKSYEASMIDSDIATNLLTGIISETHSFQHNKTTPNSFLSASELINYGAQQQEIIRNLFKVKELAVLKLWGRAMARIKQLPEYQAIYSVVGLADIEKSEAGPRDIIKVANDFMASVNHAKLLFFVAERPDHLEMYASSNPNLRFKELVQALGGEYVSANMARIKIRGAAITEVENYLVDNLQKLGSRLGL